MRLTFVQLPEFLNDMRHLGLGDYDLRALESELLNRPDAGRTIPGTGGLRKMRFSPPSWHRGKRGSTRVCYAWFAEVAAVYLFTIYSKQEADDLSAADKRYFRTILDAYSRWIRKRTGVLP